MNRPLLKFVAARLLVIPIALFGLVSLSFALVSLIPGDPARLIVGDYATPDQVAKVHHELGLDRPLAARYGHYVVRLLHGDLGNSFSTGQPVGHTIVSLLPNTMVLIVPGMLVAAGLGIAIGVVAAYFRRRWPDRAAGLAITSTQAVPDFFIGLLLIFFLYSVVRVAPAPIGMLSATDLLPRNVTGSTSVDAVVTGSWSLVASIASHALLPVVTLGIFFSSYFAKTVRTTMSQGMASPQVEFARACGLSERKVIGYAFVAARTPILTYAALLFGALLGGVAIIETVFAWPGVGSWALDGILKADVPVIQGFVLTVGVLTLFVYLLLDLAVMLLDPRIRLR